MHGNIGPRTGVCGWPMKRCFDLTLTLLALIVALPLMGILAVLVWINLGSPIFFRQLRPGLHEKPFGITKFRTMLSARDQQGNLLPDGERLTRFGRWLRATSLDELPELLNVIAGDMSLVGPRPLLMEYLGRYTPEQKRRHSVRPGITGWAQVHGRNAINWNQKFALDLWYVDHCSLSNDLKILGLTVRQVFRHEDVNQPGCATADEFLGDPRV